MRFYDVTSLLDRQKALADLYEDKEHSYLHAAINPRRVQNIWSRLPHEWRKDKEFVLTVLRITAPPSLSDEEENNNVAAADTDSDDDDDDENDDDAVSMAGSTAEITAAAAAAAAVVVPLLPSKSEFERLFPQALRFDRDVVLVRLFHLCWLFCCCFFFIILFLLYLYIMCWVFKKKRNLF
jgi:hypothetical protein